MAAQSTSSMADNQVWKAVKPFMNGGLSGMGATCVIQPLDIVKVRLQLGATGGPFGVAAGIIKNDGFGALYTGLSAGLLRQATYTTARLGIHSEIVDYLKKQNEGGVLPLSQKAGAGLVAGGLGAIFGSPADLSLIRMQADKTLPVDQRRNYTGVGHALSDIIKNEGFGGLFTGASTTAIRAMALNMGMLASNDQAKEMLAEQGFTGFPKTFIASSISGFFASFFSLPFDYVKTMLQKQKVDPATGKLPFSGMMDCAAKTFAEGGPLKFYTGFPTYYVRIAPHAMITLMVLDSIQEMQKKNGF
jgi:solute carrier family 25 (mitochondrial oxoglutarate transporter), member 11